MSIFTTSASVAKHFQASASKDPVLYNNNFRLSPEAKQKRKEDKQLGPKMNPVDIIRYSELRKKGGLTLDQALYRVHQEHLYADVKTLWDVSTQVRSELRDGVQGQLLDCLIEEKYALRDKTCWDAMEGCKKKLMSEQAPEHSLFGEYRKARTNLDKTLAFQKGLRLKYDVKVENPPPGEISLDISHHQLQDASFHSLNPNRTRGLIDMPTEFTKKAISDAQKKLAKERRMTRAELRQSILVDLGILDRKAAANYVRLENRSAWQRMWDGTPNVLEPMTEKLCHLTERGTVVRIPIDSPLTPELIEKMATEGTALKKELAGKLKAWEKEMVEAKAGRYAERLRHEEQPAQEKGAKERAREKKSKRFEKAYEIVQEVKAADHVMK